MRWTWPASSSIVSALGDLSGGFTLTAGWDPNVESQVYVEHHCGWSLRLEDHAYVANLVGPDGPIAAHRQEGCQP